MNKLVFHPCKHTKMDGLYLSSKSVVTTGRLVLVHDDGTDTTIKQCKRCKKED